MPGFLGEVRGRVSLDVKQAVAAYATVRAQNAKTVYALRGAGDSFVQSGKTMMLAGAGLLYVFGKAVKASAEFERRMDFFAAVTNASTKEVAQLREETLRLASTSIYSADQIADGVVELGKAGVTTKDIIDGIGQAMVNLGAAADIPLDQAGQIITSTIQQFALSGEDAVHVVDMLAGAANASIANIDDLGVSLKYVGGVANAVGLSFDDTLTAISLLAKAGIRGSTAGTSLRQMMVSLGGATGPATKKLEELGIILKDGTNRFFDAEGSAKSLSQVFQILQNATNDLSKKEKLAAFRTIFNNRALAAAAILTRGGAKGFRQMYKEMSKVSAADVASQRLDNLSGDLKILKSNLENTFIRAGTPVQKQLRSWVQSLTRLVKAFGKLSPETQAMIIQTVGIAGAALVALGAFNIIIGTVFRFVASIMKLGAGLKFLWHLLVIVGTNLKWFITLFGPGFLTALGAITAPVWAIIAAVIAIGVAFVVAYKKIAPFRNLVNQVVGAIVSAAKVIGKWFKTLVTDPGKAWEQLKTGVLQLLTWIGQQFAKVPGLVWKGLQAAGKAIMGWVNSAAGFFKALPGKVLGVLVDLVAKIIDLFTFKNIGYVIGFVIGTIVRGFLFLSTKLFSLAGTIVSGVVGWFLGMAPKVGYAIGFLIGRAVGLFLRLTVLLLRLAAKIVVGIIRFFMKLPGRVAAFVARMAARFIAGLQSMVRWAVKAGPQIVNGIINFMKNLPGKVWGFMVRTIAKIANAIPKAISNGISFARGFSDALLNGIRDLPSLVLGVLGNIISAIKSRIVDGFNAVKDFARGLWEGFKDGIGMHSPSHLERAMWQITGVMNEETKKLAKRTMDVQKLSKRLAKTPLTVGMTDNNAFKTITASRRIRETFQGSAVSGTKLSTANSTPKSKTTKLKLVEGKLRIDENGEAFFKGLAQEVVDDNNEFEDTFRRMG